MRWNWKKNPKKIMTNKPICKIETRTTLPDYRIEGIVNVKFGGNTILELTSFDIANILMIYHKMDLSLGSEKEYINKLCDYLPDNIRNDVCDVIFEYVHKIFKL